MNIYQNQKEITKRLNEMRKELIRDGFNFFSIIVAGFFLGLFTNIFADFIYEDFKKYYIFRWIIVLIIVLLLFYIYREFIQTFMKPKEKELQVIGERIKNDQRLLKNKKKL